MTAKKQTLTLDEVRRIARLANLPLSDAELELLAPQLSSIVAFISKLQEIDTSQTAVTSRVTSLENVWREDVVDATNQLSQDQALKNAPETHNGMFMVPAIFE